MGHFVGVYTDDLPRLRSVIGSGSAEYFASVLETCGGKFDLDSETHDRIAAALKNIIANRYPSGADDLENYYGYAFQNLCQTFSGKWTVQEIYVSEELFPEIFDFVWGAVDDEKDLHLLQDDDPFGIPDGEFGLVCRHRCADWVKMEMRRLSKLNYEQVAQMNGTDYREEIAEILEVLTAAERNGQGVFVTWLE